MRYGPVLLPVFLACPAVSKTHGCQVRSCSLPQFFAGPTLMFVIAAGGERADCYPCATKLQQILTGDCRSVRGGLASPGSLSCPSPCCRCQECTQESLQSPVLGGQAAYGKATLSREKLGLLKSNVEKDMKIFKQYRHKQALVKLMDVLMNLRQHSHLQASVRYCCNINCFAVSIALCRICISPILGGSKGSAAST